MNKLEKASTMFLHWTPITRTCYKRGMICEGCPEKFLCDIRPWNLNPLGIKNIKYAVMRILMNIGEPDKMQVCDCKKHLEFDYTLDKQLPNGDIDSIAIYKCTVCGREFTEEEVCQL